MMRPTISTLADQARRRNIQKPVIVDGGAISDSSSMPGSMDLNALIKNYESIIRTSAIYYPVAYHFVRELGRGRQGRVFLAMRQGARGCVTEHAIKLYDPSLYNSAAEYWTDMGRIAHQISMLHHMQGPNLVCRYTYEETYGIGYVQLEAIDGVDLRRLISPDQFERAKRISGVDDSEWDSLTSSIFRHLDGRLALQPGIVVYILRQVLKGLERLHSEGFLHCDVKPGNIMLDRLGMVKVVDFGRAVVGGEQLSFLLGSLMYMSPEMHRREICGPQTDMFSLGLVALEMLRGRPLTEKESVTEDELLSIKLQLSSKLQTLLPRDVLANTRLVSILKRFLAPKPEGRYASAKEADVGDYGLRVIDKQLVEAGLDTEYSRALSEYLERQVSKHTQRIDIDMG